ncbi:MAG: response regulator [Pirellulaceae bacterium]|nr:response regulator [Pirellulaceae bacterium]MDP6553227.1 response regulator [Pirellulaceae bacterium]MDP6721244.1 response regulator [Pirellulaceae bacterium]
MSLGPTMATQITSDCLPLPGSRRAKILCIDEDPQAADAIELRMGDLAVDILRASNGMQGYWLAISESPALIITDLRMTNGHGGKIIESVKGNPQTRNIPVIVLTKHDYPGLQRHAQQMGATHCFQEPYDVSALLEAVSDVLALTK